MSESQTNNPTQNNYKRFLSDDQENPSFMRLMSMLALIVAAGLAVVEIFGWG